MPIVQADRLSRIGAALLKAAGADAGTQPTYVAKVEEMIAPTNAFANLAAFPQADMKVAVRPNFDTLYSSAWLDLWRTASTNSR